MRQNSKAHAKDINESQPIAKHIQLALSVCLSLLNLGIDRPTAQAAESGISPRAILIGQSAPFSGPESGSAKQFRRGAHYALNDVNARGGIHGRQVVMIYRDDQYDPQKTRKNTETFLERDRVFALFGYKGTPTTQAALPIIEKFNTPLIAPTSGAEILRKPLNKLIFSVRASYRKEMEILVNHLVRFGREVIAIVYQNDSFGRDALAGAVDSLKRHGLKPVATIPIEHKSPNNDEAARLLALKKPEGVIILTDYPPIPNLIAELREHGSNAQIMTHSNSNIENLPSHLRRSIGVSQVVPYPWNPRIDLIRDYQYTMQSHEKKPKYDFASLEGYIAARILLLALEKTGPNPTKAGLIQSLESMQNVDLGDYRLKFSNTNHNGSSFAHLTFLMGEKGAYVH